MILNLTSLIKNPLGEEIWLALMAFISIFLILWLLSKIFKFKKQSYKIAFLIAFVVSTVSFIIRSFNIILSLNDTQKPTINIIAMIIEASLLLILIKKYYNLKWFKTFGTWLITYLLKWGFMGVLTFIIIFGFTTMSQDIQEEKRPKMSLDNFEINQYGEKININEFIVYKDKITSNNNTEVINIKSKLNFPTKTENVNLSLDCYVPYAKLFPEGMKDFTTEYKFESPDYWSEFNVKGSAYFICDNCVMNSGSTKGTKIISIEPAESATINFDFIFKFKENKEIDCLVIATNENPGDSPKKRFTIQYIAE